MKAFMAVLPHLDPSAQMTPHESPPAWASAHDAHQALDIPLPLIFAPATTTFARPLKRGEGDGRRPSGRAVNRASAPCMAVGMA
jgi:hypothetical protein